MPLRPEARAEFALSHAHHSEMWAARLAVTATLRRATHPASDPAIVWACVAVRGRGGYATKVAPAPTPPAFDLEAVRRRSVFVVNVSFFYGGEGVYDRIKHRPG